MPLESSSSWLTSGRCRFAGMLACMTAVLAVAYPVGAGETAPGLRVSEDIVAPRPMPAKRPGVAAPAQPTHDPGRGVHSGFEVKRQAALPVALSEETARMRRASRMGTVASWGYQLAGLDVAAAAASPYDLLVIDATTGVGDGRAMSERDVARLKSRPDGRRRLVVSYLSIGEAEDYRPDYFSAEYLEEEAPDWLMHENPQWKGNRIISFCDEGWQRTILGDDQGRNVYNSIEPSPLYRLIELGLDGVYLDRVDVYSEVGKACPDAARRMVQFVKRLAEHARRRNPDFMVILQNAEELLRYREMIDSIDAIAKEDLFYGVDHSEAANAREMVRDTLANLRLARGAGRPVFFVDYIGARGKIADARRRGAAEGFVAYFGPRDLARLWLPGRDF